jgi:predicted dehydrogenase
VNETIRVGVVGTGALGQHHARVYANTPGARLVGAFDQLPGRGQEVAERHGGRGFDSLEALLGECDAVSVAVPTIDHLAVARAAFAAGCDVLVEKPLAPSLAEADALIAAGEAAGRILQVGHIERFNPAADLLFRGGAPRFIEVHRLAPFTPRSLDIDVVLDLMIHDLDIVLALDGSEAV